MLDFTIDQSGQIVICLATPPSWCTGIVLELPNGQHYTYTFNGHARADLDLSPSDLVNKFLDHLEVNEDRLPNTLRGYRQRLGQFLDWLSRHNQKLASPESWLAYYASLKRRDPTLSPYTLKGHYHILNRFGRWLVQKHYLGWHPLIEVDPPKLPKDDLPKAIFKDHIKKMMAAAARSPRNLALLLFFRDTGCRAVEALDLTWSKINLATGQATVQGKRKIRQVFLKPLTCRTIEKYRATLEHCGPDDPVWQGRRGPLKYNGLYKIFKRLAHEAGVGDDIFNPHAWRHAFGRDTTIAGIPTAQLQDLLGHGSIETTKIYARFDTTELQEAHDRYSPVDGDLTVEGDLTLDGDGVK